MQIRLYETGLFDCPEKMELILETEDERYNTIEFGGFVVVNGETYRMCMYSQKDKILGVQPVKDFEEEPNETNYESEFVCPFCKAVNHDAWELGDEGEHQCGSCSSTMKYVREIEVTYSIEPVECAPITKFN